MLGQFYLTPGMHHGDAAGAERPVPARSPMMGGMPIDLSQILDPGDSSLYEIRSKTPGAQGSLPLTGGMLLERPSGDLFGWARTPAWAGSRRRSAGRNS